MELLKALGGVNAAAKQKNDEDGDATSVAAHAKKSTAERENKTQYNPMASLIERHENAVNRIKRGK